LLLGTKMIPIDVLLYQVVGTPQGKIKL